MTDQLEPKDARVPVASKDLFVLDVRDTEEWNDDSERIPGSVHIPADEVDSNLDDLPEDRKILVVCPDGELSAQVAERLDGAGREATSLEGGVERWKKDKLLTQPSPDAEPAKAEGEPPHEEPEDDEEAEREGADR